MKKYIHQLKLVVKLGMEKELGLAPSHLQERRREEESTSTPGIRNSFASQIMETEGLLLIWRYMTSFKLDSY